MKKAKQQVIDRILEEKIFAVLRLQETAKIEEIAATISNSGIKIIEITLNSKNALEAIHRMSRACPDCLIGAGTVIGYEAAAKAIESGAKFLVSPVADLDMIAVANEVGVTCMAGAFTPTEAWQSTVAGADFVKVFPLAGIGPQFIRALRGPLDSIRYVVTNGATVDNVTEFLDAGAVAVGLGSSLISDEDILKGDLSIIGARGEKAVAAVAKYKETVHA